MRAMAVSLQRDKIDIMSKTEPGNIQNMTVGSRCQCLRSIKLTCVVCIQMHV
jgi:hypothetical protein